jgi:hypothetical protein
MITQFICFQYSERVKVVSSVSTTKSQLMRAILEIGRKLVRDSLACHFAGRAD